jgi:ankyrin repeat protein
MKHLLLTTIAAVLVVGCGPQPPDISIHKAAGLGDIEAVKQHLAGGVDVYVKEDRYGRTPLHYAASNGQKEIAELLIAEGADVNAKDKERKTPLDYAVALKHPELADLLLKHGGKTAAELKAESK